MQGMLLRSAQPLRAASLRSPPWKRLLSAQAPQQGWDLSCGVRSLESPAAAFSQAPHSLRVSVCGMSKAKASSARALKPGQRRWAEAATLPNLAAMGLDGKCAVVIPPAGASLKVRAAASVVRDGTLGDDACLVAKSADGALVTLGVADGVGGWANVGVSPALFSHRLMEAVHAAASAPGPPAAAAAAAAELPLSLLASGYERVRSDGSVVAGSSTALLATVNLADLSMRAANVGDCEMCVVRGGKVVFSTLPQMHSSGAPDEPPSRFDAPFQLAVLPPELSEAGNCDDKPSDAVLSTWQLEPADMIVLGTDGLWDNLSFGRFGKADGSPGSGHNIASQLYRYIEQELAELDADRAAASEAGAKLDVPDVEHTAELARLLLTLAQHGPKVDDITVLCARVSESPEQRAQYAAAVERIRVAKAAAAASAAGAHGHSHGGVPCSGHHGDDTAPPRSRL